MQTEMKTQSFKRLQSGGERKFLRTVVHLGMLFRGTHGIAPVNIIDEAIDEALVARGEVIKHNTAN